MAEFITSWAEQIIKHVPFVTWVGLSLAVVFVALHFGKRWRECALLAAVCVAYGLTPYVPHW